MLAQKEKEIKKLQLIMFFEGFFRNES